MAKISFREDRCKGCGLCTTVCPKKIVQLSRDRINSKGYRPAECIDESACIGCFSCGTICPDCVITIEREAAK